MSDLQQLHSLVVKQLLKSILHLEYSFAKISKLSNEIDVENISEETLETWESFCARFSRVADIFLIKYIRTTVKIDDPGFNGSFKDFLNQAEKLNIISDVALWMRIRELRNIIAHEYSVQDVSAIFIKVKENATILIKIKELFEK